VKGRRREKDGKMRFEIAFQVKIEYYNFE